MSGGLKLGTFGGRDIAVPEYVLNYMSDKANELLESGNSLSKRQHKAIEKNIIKNANTMISTAMYGASIADKKK
jgi:hypothetical protein